MMKSIVRILLICFIIMGLCSCNNKSSILKNAESFSNTADMKENTDIDKEETQEITGEEKIKEKTADESEIDFTIEKKNLWKISGNNEEMRNFSDGVAWVYYEENWIIIDTKGNILFCLNSDCEPVTDFINGFAVIKKQNENNKRILIDKKGRNVLIEFMTMHNTDDTQISVLSIGKNKELVDIWLKVVTDTYPENKEEIWVFNQFSGMGVKSGELNYKNLAIYSKEMIESNDTINFERFNDMDIPDDGVYINPLGEGMYTLSIKNQNKSDKAVVYNTNSGELFHIKNLYDSSVYTDGVMSTKDSIIDMHGNTIRQMDISDAVVGRYSEGLYIVGQTKNNLFICDGFYDLDGKKVIDLSGYATRTSPNLPFFKNGYCVLQLVNDADDDYFTILDKNGKLLFKPQRGTVIGNDWNEEYCVTDNTIIVYDDNREYRYVDINGKNVLEKDKFPLEEDTNQVLEKFHDGFVKMKNAENEYVFIDKEGQYLFVDLSVLTFDVTDVEKNFVLDEVEYTLDSIIKYEYDTKGNVIQETQYNEEGKGVSEYFEYKYDINDTVMIKIEWNSSPFKFDRTDYDKNGNLVEWKSYKEGNLWSCYKCKYNSSGNEIESDSYDNDGSLLYSYKYEYDIKGNLVEQKQYYYYEDLGRKLNSSYRFWYDSNRNMTEKIFYDESGELWTSTKYEYDADGNMIEEKIYNENGSLRTFSKYEYDINGNKINYKEYMSDGLLLREKEYDQNGYMIKNYSWLSKRLYIYKRKLNDIGKPAIEYVYTATISKE